MIRTKIKLNEHITIEFYEEIINGESIPAVYIHQNQNKQIFTVALKLETLNKIYKLANTNLSAVEVLYGEDKY
jgi:hypothetical protein